MNKKIVFLLIFIVLFLGCLYYINHRTYNIKVVEVNNKYLHFSLDDVHNCLQSLSTTDKESIFNDSTLAILKDWHDRYGIVVSIYCQGPFCINSKYGNELNKNSSWLKFGYHGTKRMKLDIGSFYKQIRDSTGSEAIIDYCPRLDRFNASYLTCMFLKAYGCIGFLSCDDWAFNAKGRKRNYYLSEEQSALLDNNSRAVDPENGLLFIKSDFRLEQIKKRWGNTANCLKYYETSPKQAKELIVFSHEWCFKQYVSQADSIFRWAIDNGYYFDFPINN